MRKRAQFKCIGDPTCSTMTCEHFFTAPLPIKGNDIDFHFTSHVLNRDKVGADLIAALMVALPKASFTKRSSNTS